MNKIKKISVDHSLCQDVLHSRDLVALQEQLGFASILMRIENRALSAYYAVALDDLVASLSYRAIYDSSEREWLLVYWAHRKWNIVRSFDGVRDGFRDLFEFLETNGYV